MFVLAVSLLFLSRVRANNCLIDPIYVDFHVRNVDGGVTSQYGLFTGIGTPSQNLSSWPSLSYNETTVASVAYCQNGSSTDCASSQHGFYVPNLSETLASPLFAGKMCLM